MRKLYYLVSAAAIATMVAALTVPASAQPFSEMMGSWGYGGYGAFHMVLWVLILIAFIFGVDLASVDRKTWHAQGVRAPFRRPRRTRKETRYHRVM